MSVHVGSEKLTKLLRDNWSKLGESMIKLPLQEGNLHANNDIIHMNFELLQFIKIIYIRNKSIQYVICLSFIVL